MSVGLEARELEQAGAAAPGRKIRVRRRRGGRKEAAGAASSSGSNNRDSSEDEIPSTGSAEGRGPKSCRNVVTWSDLLGEGGLLEGMTTASTTATSSPVPAVCASASVAATASSEEWLSLGPPLCGYWGQEHAGVGAPVVFEQHMGGVLPPYGGADVAAMQCFHTGQSSTIVPTATWTVMHGGAQAMAGGGWCHHADGSASAAAAAHVPGPPLEAAPVCIGGEPSSDTVPPPPPGEAALDMLLRELAGRDVYED